MRRVVVPALCTCALAQLGVTASCTGPDISLFDPSTTSGGGAGPVPPQLGGMAGAEMPSPRDPLVAPFSSSSIWNTPLGRDAQLVPAAIQSITDAAFTPAEVIVVMAPTAPSVPVYFNGNGFVSGADRCTSEGDLFGEVPIPDNFIIPNTPDGTPNNQATFLLPDARTIAQTEPFYRCTASGIGTTLVEFAEDDLWGAGLVGASGGSGMSSLGGTLRLGELRPGDDHVRHSLRIHLNSVSDLFDCAEESECFRWPARWADSGALSLYGGTNASLRMGALLAISSASPIESLNLETELALELAWTLQNFGAYVVNDAGWSTFAIGMERSPLGRFVDQVEADYNIDLDNVEFETPFARDVERLLSALWVVNDNSAASPGGNGTRMTPASGDLEPIE